MNCQALKNHLQTVFPAKDKEITVVVLETYFAIEQLLETDEVSIESLENLEYDEPNLYSLVVADTGMNILQLLVTYDESVDPEILKFICERININYSDWNGETIFEYFIYNDSEGIHWTHDQHKFIVDLISNYDIDLNKKSKIKGITFYQSMVKHFCVYADEAPLCCNNPNCELHLSGFDLMIEIFLILIDKNVSTDGVLDSLNEMHNERKDYSEGLTGAQLLHTKINLLRVWFPEWN
jgi:hypothetical protein